jgi:hypothetical protein
LFDARNDRVLITAGADGKLKVWEVDVAGENITLLSQQEPANKGAIQGLSYAIMSGEILSIGDDGIANVWQLQDGQLQLVDQITTGGKAQCGAISSDGRWLAVGDGVQVSLWDRESGKPLGNLVGHLANVNSITFSYDSLRVVTSSGDSTLRIWDTSALADVAEGEPPAFAELLPLEEHSGAVNAAQFSPTGQYLISAGADGQTIIWPADAVLPSINVPNQDLQYAATAQNVTPLELANQARLVSPTLSDFHAAQLTVEVSSTDDAEAPVLDEMLDVVLPDGFVVASRSPTKLVIARQDVPAPTTVLACLLEQRKWEEVLRAIQYRVATDQRETSPVEFTAEREVKFRLENGRRFEPSSTAASADGPPLSAEDSVHLRVISSHNGARR